MDYRIQDTAELAERKTELEEWKEDGEGLEEEEEEELRKLTELEEYMGAAFGEECLIAVDTFPEYCRELLQDMGDLPRDLPWYIEIDWEATAENIRQDYTEVEYDGEDWYYRSY